MRRALALLAAAAMIAGAVAVRSLIDDDDSSASGSTSGGNSDNGDEPLRVRCATVAEAACDALSDAGFTVRTEAAGRTADALSQAGPADDLGFDVWITTRSWPGMVEAQRRTDLAGGVLDEPQDIGAQIGAEVKRAGDEIGISAPCVNLDEHPVSCHFFA